ncbi:MAG: Gfo/Idh/MocA family oxidoreductase [Phycisphaerales bacterium]|nr:Gfo/Idh/MocA family oxidoreductase [Phycisphaerales bacterium]
MIFNRFVLILFLIVTTQSHAQDAPLRLAVIGLDHGHVEGVLFNSSNRTDLELVGIYDPNYKLFEKYQSKYKLNHELFYDNLEDMLEECKPEAASVMTPISDHLNVVQICAPLGVHTLLEKPLTYDYDDAVQMSELALEYDVHVLTNFETSWYSSVRTAIEMLDSGETGQPNRVIFRHGHKGPIEIGCAPEFVEWLAHPKYNGGGALIDFGCYGVNIMTKIMNNQLPDSVTAITQQVKPDLYPLVDDNATIILNYPTVTTIIQASWSWTHDNKEMDIHASNMSIHAAKWDALEVRMPDSPRIKRVVTQNRDQLSDEWTYLKSLVREECEVDPFSSIENNLVVAQILDAAIESASTGKTINLNN